MWATGETLKLYIETFHGTLDREATRFFPGDRAKQLLHCSLRPAPVRCFVSGNFGVAVEYLAKGESSIESITGSARIEELFLDAPESFTQLPAAIRISAAGCKLQRFTIKGGFPFRLIGEQASVQLCDMVFSAEDLGWKRVVHFAEIFGDRRASRWSTSAAENRAKDEILGGLAIAALAKRRGDEIFEFVSRTQEKTVLVLGGFERQGRARLEKISEALESLGYASLLLDQVPDFRQYSLAQKTNVLAGLARFVVVDDTEPSGHLAEIAYCDVNSWLLVVLHEDGNRGSWMSAGLAARSTTILECDYPSNDPAPRIAECARWAEARFVALGRVYDSTYPWRT